MGAKRAPDLRSERSDLGHDRLQGADQAKHGRSAGLDLELAGAPGPGASHRLQQLLGGLAARVAVAREEGCQALWSESLCVGRDRVAPQEGEGDRCIYCKATKRSRPSVTPSGTALR